MAVVCAAVHCTWASGQVSARPAWTRAYLYHAGRRAYPPAVVGLVLDAIGIRSGTKVLEIGPGTGQLSVELCRPSRSRLALALITRCNHDRISAMTCGCYRTSSPVRALPMIRRWISEVPSKIVKILASLCQRSTGKSLV
jgi:hypothetical protein